jgi:hypothetical protein
MYLYISMHHSSTEFFEYCEIASLPLRAAVKVVILAVTLSLLGSLIFSRYDVTESCSDGRPTCKCRCVPAWMLGQ